MARKFGRIVNITSAAVKAPIEMLGLSNGARAGLTGFVAGIVAQDRDRQRHHQRPAAGPVRYRPPARHREGRSGKARRRRRADPGGTRQAQSGRPVRRRPRNSVWPARSCAAPRPASSPARTSCSTAARSRARCNEGGLVRANGPRARGADLWRDADANGRPGRSPGAAGGVRRQSRRCRPPRRQLPRDGISARDSQQRRRRDRRPGRRRRHAARRSASASGCSTASATAAPSARRRNTSRSPNIW